MDNNSYFNKYNKYKQKYLNLKKMIQQGGSSEGPSMEEVRKAIKEKTGIPKDQQSIQFSGRVSGSSDDTIVIAASAPVAATTAETGESKNTGQTLNITLKTLIQGQILADAQIQQLTINKNQTIQDLFNMINGITGFMPNQGRLRLIKNGNVFPDKSSLQGGVDSNMTINEYNSQVQEENKLNNSDELIFQVPSDEEINLFIMGDLGRFQIKAKKTDTIFDIKNKLKINANIKDKEIMTIFGGRSLEDKFTLFDYDVNNDATLHVYIKK